MARRISLFFCGNNRQDIGHQPLLVIRYEYQRPRLMSKGQRGYILSACPFGSLYSLLVLSSYFVAGKDLNLLNWVIESRFVKAQERGGVSC